MIDSNLIHVGLKLLYFREVDSEPKVLEFLGLYLSSDLYEHHCNLLIQKPFLKAPLTMSTMWLELKIRKKKIILIYILLIGPRISQTRIGNCSFILSFLFEFNNNLLIN